MSETKIKTVEKLEHYLHVAMQIEHATIPPYLLALYSIRPGTNLDATQILRVVVVEEMLHLTLGANLLNAIGGKPDLTKKHFVPDYPATLPDGEKDFKVDLQPFSRDAVETFLKIERPAKAPSEAKRFVSRHRAGFSALAASMEDSEMEYYSIGEFYEEIRRGLHYLHEKMGDDLFKGAHEHPGWQVTPEHYYSGGGKLVAVKDLKTAQEAVNLIIEQGEGFGGGIFNDESELAHLFRFDQLRLGRYYQKGDTPGNPSGPALTVNWDAVYPFKKNPKLADYPASSELHAAAVEFNQTYAGFLAMLTKAYNGEPQLLMTAAVPGMFRLRNKINQLIHNPIPGMSGVNAAPTFEIAAATGVSA